MRAEPRWTSTNESGEHWPAQYGRGETHQAQLDEHQLAEGDEEEEKHAQHRRPHQVGLGGDQHSGA